MHCVRLIYNKDDEQWKEIDDDCFHSFDSTSEQALIDDSDEDFVLDACIQHIDSGMFGII